MSARKPQRPRWTRARRWSQALVALGFLAVPIANRLGHHQVAGTLVSLKIGPFDIVEPASGFAAIIAGREAPLVLILGLLPLVALALLLGPVFCSWMCPWGLISEGLDAWRSRRARWTDRSWLRVRAVRAATLAGLLIAGGVLATPFAALVAGPRLITTLPLEGLYLRVFSPVTGVLLLALLALELLGPRRLWCRALCPAGAVANYLRTPKTLTVQFDEAACIEPKRAACHTACRWGIDPRAMTRYDGCTTCLRCIDACPSGALSFGERAARQPATTETIAHAPAPVSPASESAGRAVEATAAPNGPNAE